MRGRDWGIYVRVRSSSTGAPMVFDVAPADLRRWGRRWPGDVGAVETAIKAFGLHVATRFPSGWYLNTRTGWQQTTGAGLEGAPDAGRALGWEGHA